MHLFSTKSPFCCIMHLMSELQNTQEDPVRAFLVGKDDGTYPISELHGLVKTLGMTINGSILLSRYIPTPQFGIGTGKAHEIIALAQEAEAECIILDFEISPTQQRNWEKEANLPVFDRNEVIIRIFAQRAKTKEAVLQVHLARLQYAMPRLAHSYGDMARQRGGSYGSKGSGETQLEIDRRDIKEQIAQIKDELKKVIKERETMRKRREKIPLPSCALVGYTNAGKSSLLNSLTGSGVFVEDKLFATLDPTTRRLSLSGGTGILLTDTVGFIRNLPHTLIDAFKSTLEEAVRADLLLIVLDASDTDVFGQYETVCTVLEEIGASKNKRLLILNKTDKEECERNFSLSRIKETGQNALEVSAKNSAGFDALIEAIADSLFGTIKEYSLKLSDTELLNEIRKNGILVSSEWTEDAVKIKARISEALETKLFAPPSKPLLP